MWFFNKKSIKIGGHVYKLDIPFTRYTGIRIYINPLGKKSDYSINFKGIEKLIRLCDVLIDGRNIDLVDFTELNKVKLLKEIIFDSQDKMTKIPDLSGLKNLRSVIFNNYDFKTLEGIEKYQQVLELKFWDNALPDISALSGLKRLESLALDITGNCNISFKTISDLPQLSDIYIRNAGIVDLSGIDQFMNLTSLTIFMDIDVTNINEISKLKRLESIKMFVWTSFTTLDFLAELYNLKEIDLTFAYDGHTPEWEKNYEKKKIDLTPIKNLKEVKAIVLHGFIIEHFEVLNVLHKLNFCDVAWCSFSPPNSNILENKELHITTEADYGR